MRVPTPATGDEVSGSEPERTEVSDLIAGVLPMLRRVRTAFPFGTDAVTDGVVDLLARRFCQNLDHVEDAVREVSYLVDLVDMALEQVDILSEDETVLRVARELKAGAIDAGVSVARALTPSDAVDRATAAETTLFALRIEILSGDPVSAAERLLDMASPGERTHSEVLGLLHDYVVALCGETSSFGVRFPSSLAVEIARIVRRFAEDDDASADLLLKVGGALAASTSTYLRPEPVEEAVLDLRQSLRHWRETRNRIEAVRTQDRIGDFLQILAIAKQDASYVDQAVEEYRGALEMIDRSEHPLEWATLQNHLGCAFAVLAKSRGEVAYGEAAIAPLRIYFEEHRRRGASPDLVSAQLNLGNALAEVAWANGDVGGLREASAHLRSVVASARRDLPPEMVDLIETRRSAIRAEVTRLRGSSARKKSPTRH